MSSTWSKVVEACRSGVEACREALESFSSTICNPPEVCVSEKPRRREASYRWVDKLIEKGVPDGRARLILYVISRYLVNIRKMSEEEAIKVIQVFVENSCRNHGNCGKIYQSWIASTIRGVKKGGWKPWSLAKIKERDPELYEIVSRVLSEQ